MRRYEFSGRFTKRSHIDLTPLVDLVFLLVIFFMVSSTLGKHSAIHISLPFAEKSSLADDSSIVISVNESNEIYIDDMKIDKNSFLIEINRRKNDFEGKKVLIRGDKSANYETIILVMDSLNKSGIASFSLSTVRQ